MSVLLQLGVVDVTSGLLLCAATSGFGVVLFVRAGRAIVTPGPARADAIAPISTPPSSVVTRVA
jgi:hypothetical protein